MQLMRQAVHQCGKRQFESLGMFACKQDIPRNDQLRPDCKDDKGHQRP